MIFAPRLGAPEGTVDILTDDGERIRTVVLGLSYFDPVSGDDVVLSEVNPDVVSEILPPNRVIYRNAFTDIEADVIYEYHRDRFSQNIVLHESPADPAAFGLSKLSRLEVLSEILEAPEPEKEVRVVKELAKDQKERRQMAEPDLIDETIRFGESSIGQGKAFVLGDQPGTEAIVTKRWVEDGGRTVLFEGVEIESVKETLERLPSSSQRSRASMPGNRGKGGRQIPVRLYASNNRDEETPMQIASAKTESNSGFLIDYEIVINGSSNFVFETGKTYYVGGYFTVNGTTVFEGGAIIKHYTTGHLAVSGPVDFKGSEYSPVVFTSMHDDTVGEPIAGSSGTPPAGPYSDLNPLLIANGLNNDVRHFRVKFAETGIRVDGAGVLNVSDAQFLDCDYPIEGWTATIVAENILIDGGITAFQAPNVSGTNLTIHYVDGLGGGVGVALKNCLIVNVSSVQSYTGQGASHNVELSSATGVFQSAGGGHYYLANNSPYRDIGTSSIDPGLAAELETRATYPPTVLANPTTLTNNTNWTPHVARDDDGTLDIGYHYAPLDYLFQEVRVAPGFELVVRAGTSLGQIGTEHGLILDEGASVRMLGKSDSRVVYTRYNNVQEEDSGLPETFHRFLLPWQGSGGGSPIREIEIKNADFFAGVGPVLTPFLNHVGIFNGHISLLDIAHSRFFGGILASHESLGMVSSIKNNLMRNCRFWMFGDQTLELRNNLVLNGLITIDQNSGAGAWIVQDNLFDAVTESWPGSISNGTLGHNGYLNTTFRPNGVTQSSDIVLSSLAYESGPFGDYYQPGTSPLINAGSQLADAAGLLHHTVLATGPPEGTASSVSMVDIGLHYPAVGSAEGGLLDSDWDGIPNVLEDQNGNGTTEAGESAWKASESPHSNGPGSIIIFNRSGATL